jgi:TonB family protein
MTRTLRTCLALALIPSLGLETALAQGGRLGAIPSSANDDNIGVGIEQTGVLVYPPTLLYSGVDSGEARISISVDRDGNLKDSLVTAYTEREFADAALAAIKRWRYKPAKAGGIPMASRCDLLFEFRNAGVIVQTLPGAELRRIYFSTMNERFQYKPCQLRDLDRIPTPVHVVSPLVNPDEKLHSVTVEFFIDEKGLVRMAAVPREEADNIYAAAAVAAVEQWRFEPPVRKGEPVLVLAQQEFNFRPKR